MGYCDANCEYLTNRHICRKYGKKLTYCKVTVCGNSFGATHEKCTECDKDYYIAELHEKIKKFEEEVQQYKLIENATIGEIAEVLKEFSKIGTVEECREAMEKQMPK